jgi:hypothetical protein
LPCAMPTACSASISNTRKGSSEQAHPGRAYAG